MPGNQTLRPVLLYLHKVLVRLCEEEKDEDEQEYRPCQEEHFEAPLPLEMAKIKAPAKRWTAVTTATISEYAKNPAEKDLTILEPPSAEKERLELKHLKHTQLLLTDLPLHLVGRIFQRRMFLLVGMFS